MEHFMKQNEIAKDVPFYEAKRKRRRMDHFMKQNGKAKDGNKRKQNENAKDGPFYEAKRKRKGWTIL